VRDPDGRFVGILMDRAEGVDLQRALFVKPLLEKTFPHWTRRNLVDLALDVVQKVRELHRRNVLLGDLNPRNILADPQGRAWFVDLDSCQVGGYPCPVGTPTFTPPEIQGRDFKTFLRTPEQEQFALATLIFMILLPGKPPYSHRAAPLRRRTSAWGTSPTRWGRNAPAQSLGVPGAISSATSPGP
jgi:DNA-binding helix-hairpin-helix protein with protein kinase domain